MSSIAVTGIGELVTCDGSDPDLLGIRSKAALIVENGLIAWIGPAAGVPSADSKIDVDGRVIIPGFVDSHSHLVFAGDRSSEFVARMTGQPYDSGGIGVTVAATRTATDEELTRLLATRIEELRALGTTTVEIKSGYGLTVADEVRALDPEIVRRLALEERLDLRTDDFGNPVHRLPFSVSTPEALVLRSERARVPKDQGASSALWILLRDAASRLLRMRQSVMTQSPRHERRSCLMY